MTFVLDPQLAEVIACPCPEHGTLVAGTPADPRADALTCQACGRSFPVTDGIPVLLLDEAFAAPAGDRTAPGGPVGPAS